MSTKSTAVAITDAPAYRLAAIDPTNPVSLLNVAAEMARFIREKKLTHNVQGKEYINVEGWQFLFACNGYRVKLGKVKRLTTREEGGEIAYSAKLKIMNAAGEEVTGGYATCSNKESGKKFYAEYAIASMAQTRAIGKAGRLVFGFLAKAEGFEATPAEEMEFLTTTTAPAVTATGPQANAPVAVAVPAFTLTTADATRIVAAINHERVRQKGTGRDIETAARNIPLREAFELYLTKVEKANAEYQYAAVEQLSA